MSLYDPSRLSPGVGRLNFGEQRDKPKGVFGKYIIEKADGSSVESEACYFVLRLDKDKAARKAMRVYAKECGNEQLASDILRCVDWLDDPPPCTCGGGRDHDVICSFHDGGMFGHPVWNHGGTP